MKHLFVLPLLSCIFPLYGETGVSTADILLVRNSPTLRGAIIGQVPFGSRLEYNASATVADGHSWVFSSSAGGFIAREYLAMNIPTIVKTMRLTSVSYGYVCNSEPYEATDALLMTSNTFEYSGGGHGGDLSFSYCASGTYSIIPGGISLHFLRLQMVQQPEYRSVDFIMRLNYETRLSGFLVSKSEALRVQYPYFLDSLRSTYSIPGSEGFVPASATLDYDNCQFTYSSPNYNHTCKNRYDEGYLCFRPH